jgi:3-methyladenine DNA glycosylase AlkD
MSRWAANGRAGRYLRRLRGELHRAGDPAKAAAMQAYMKSQMPFHGVSAAELRAIARLVFSDLTFSSASDWSTSTWRMWQDAKFREEWYAVVHPARSRPSAPYQTPQAIPTYERMIVSGAWWDTVDELSIRCVGPILRAYPEEVRPVLLAWSRSPDMWKRRCSIIAQVGSKSKTDPELLQRCMNESMASREFFLRKAIGWALRQYAYVAPDWVRGFVKEHENDLSPLSRREAMRHL